MFDRSKFDISPRVKDWLIKNGFENISKELKVKRNSYRRNSRILTKYSLNNCPINKKILGTLGQLLIDFVANLILIYLTLKNTEG